MWREERDPSSVVTSDAAYRVCRIGAVPPPLHLPEDLRAAFARHGEAKAREVEEYLRKAPRPCVYVTSERIGEAPLRRGALGRLLGMRTAAAVLPSVQSKFGGVPYVEGSVSWERARFLGQINFAEVPMFPGMSPRKGILALDRVDDGSSAPLRVRWYSEPLPSRAVDSAHVPSVGRFETAIKFRPGWTLPRDAAWYALVPESDVHGLWDAWNEFAPEGFDEDENTHRLFGHRAGGLEDHYGFEPREGRSGEISDYELLMRITFDNQAGFGWGTNWMHVLIHKDDLAAGAFDRTVVTGSNS